MTIFRKQNKRKKYSKRKNNSEFFVRDPQKRQSDFLIELGEYMDTINNDDEYNWKYLPYFYFIINTYTDSEPLEPFQITKKIIDEHFINIRTPVELSIVKSSYHENSYELSAHNI